MSLAPWRIDDVDRYRASYGLAPPNLPQYFQLQPIYEPEPEDTDQ